MRLGNNNKKSDCMGKILLRIPLHGQWTLDRLMYIDACAQVADTMKDQLRQNLERELLPTVMGKKGGQRAYSIWQLVKYMGLFLGNGNGHH